MATRPSKRRNGAQEPDSPIQTPSKKPRNNGNADVNGAVPAALESSETVDRTLSPPSASPANHEAQALVSSPPPQPSDTQLGTQTQTQTQHIPFPDHSDSQTEIKTGVWGYLTSIKNVGVSLTLKKRESDGLNTSSQVEGRSSGYLIGRHRECDLILTDPAVSNRHCVIFVEGSENGPVAILEDLSTNGTSIGGTLVGRNKRRKLNDGDEIQISQADVYLFRYPRHRFIGRFEEAYKLGDMLGSGHFASVYRATEKASGKLVAVKIFLNSKKVSAFQQEVAVLMSVNHKSILSLKETYDEASKVYLILEYAPKGELFNLIIEQSKLSEPDTRKIFLQLFDGLQYLHERGIVHRDIKPENILVMDNFLTVKLADFGLAKIIGEDSFTTSLCGTPSYVAPEVLANSKERQYSKPVDIWSLGVVLYICLCGFPPFSDELFSPDYPYNLVQQISEGLYEFPSPYWDHIVDAALELISAMLTVDADKRITIQEAKKHCWTLDLDSDDAASDITGALQEMKFKKRRVKRERTLISAKEYSETFNDSSLSSSTVKPKGKENAKAVAKEVAEGKVVDVKKEEGKEGEVEVLQPSEVEEVDEGEPVDEA